MILKFCSNNNNNNDKKNNDNKYNNDNKDVKYENMTAYILNTKTYRRLCCHYHSYYHYSFYHCRYYYCHIKF